MGGLDWRHVFLVEMLVNAIVATCWSIGAWWVARREPLIRWPVRWRWLVFNWMWTKAALFWAITLALIVTLPDGPAEVVLGVFTIAHVWAFARWLRLPNGAPNGRNHR